MYLESPEDKGERMVPIVELLQARNDDAETNALLEERSSWYKDAEKELVEAHEQRALITRLLRENGGGLRDVRTDGRQPNEMRTQDDQSGSQRGTAAVCKIYRRHQKSTDARRRNE